jgi:hypothetical protein
MLSRNVLRLFRGTGLPEIDARDDFERARRAHRAARAARWLPCTHAGRTPRLLDRADGAARSVSRLEIVPLRAIVGTAEETPHFDARFRPASDHLRRRWERIALAHHTGVPLPPISLIKRGGCYYVVDGRHRVSVALALGRADMEAYVTEIAPLAGDTGCDQLAA